MSLHLNLRRRIAAIILILLIKGNHWFNWSQNHGSFRAEIQAVVDSPCPFLFHFASDASTLKKPSEYVFPWSSEKFGGNKGIG